MTYDYGFEASRAYKLNSMLLTFSGVTVLLSLTVFQQSISEAMPITSLQIPLLGKLD
jgi:hypothetical protein